MPLIKFFNEFLFCYYLHVFSKKVGKYTMESKYWMAVSEEAKDLVKKLLTYNPENRISAQEALQHAWFQINMGAPQLLNS